MNHATEQPQTRRGDMAYELVGDTLVLCHNDKTPSDADWNAWVSATLEVAHKKVLISSHGGGPSAAQRTRLSQARSSLPPEQVALLSDSSVLRGVLTAVAWLTGNNVKPFSPRELTEALRWLGLPLERQREIEVLIARLHRTLDDSSGRRG